MPESNSVRLKDYGIWLRAQIYEHVSIIRSVMKNLRKEDLSLYRYIKDTVLRDFVEKEELIPLELLTELSCNGSYVYQAQSVLEPSPIDRGRGWTFFDCPSYDADGDCIYSTDNGISEFVTVNGTDYGGTISGTEISGTSCIGTPEQSYRIVLYDEDLTVISGTNHLVDYTDGRIIMDNNTVVPKYIDYYWNYVSVVDEWASIEASDPPVVVIDTSGTDKEGYQLGGGKKVKRKVEIHVFAGNTSERNDIVETIHDGLYNKSAPVYDFATGDVLDYDGTFYGRKHTSNKLTSLFNRTSLNDLGQLHGGMEFNKVSSRHVNLPLLMSRDRGEVMLSDLNAYRSRISFEIETYTRK